MPNWVAMSSMVTCFTPFLSIKSLALNNIRFSIVQIEPQNYGNYLRFQSFRAIYFIIYAEWQKRVKFDP